MLTYLLKKCCNTRITSTVRGGGGGSENGWNAQRSELWKMKTVKTKCFLGLKSQMFRQCCLHLALPNVYISFQQSVLFSKMVGIIIYMCPIMKLT